jgi:hypothetical protein
VLATVGVIGFVLSDWPGRLVPLAVSCAALGFVAFAALPTGLELCVETTYPVNEGLSTSVPAGAASPSTFALARGSPHGLGAGAAA